MDRMLRPEATVLPESALVPEAKLHAPPDKFTHQLVTEQAYYDSAPSPGSAPSGRFPAGTGVKLLSHDGGPACQVVDARGLCVFTAFEGLRPLP